MRRSKGKKSRGHSSENAKPYLFIVSEGKTEERILHTIRKYYRISKKSMEIYSEIGDPLSIFKYAKTHASKDSQVWLIFDRDEHLQWAQAIRRAETNNPQYNLAVSNPCIELWGIILFEDQTGYIERGDAQKRLSKLDSVYHHKHHPYLTEESILLFKEAFLRAERLLLNPRDPKKKYCNPTTTFHRLIEAIEKCS